MNFKKIKKRHWTQCPGFYERFREYARLMSIYDNHVKDLSKIKIEESWELLLTASAFREKMIDDIIKNEMDSIEKSWLAAREMKSSIKNISIPGYQYKNILKYQNKCLLKQKIESN